MDLAVSMSSTDRATSPYDSLRPVTGPVSPSPQAYRAFQSPISDLASTHSPRRFHQPSSRISPPPAVAEGTDMDLPPATLDSTQTDHHSRWRHVQSPAASPIPDSQDHDRMETDDDNHDSSSEDDLGNHQEITQPEFDHTTPIPLQDDEIMDTTPDEPHTEEYLDGGALGSLPLNPPSPSPTAPVQNQSSVEPDPPETSEDSAIPHNPPSSSEGILAETPEVAASSILTATDMNPLQDTAQFTDTIAPPPFFPSLTEDAPAIPPPPGGDNQPESAEQQQGREDDSSQEESSDEEERAYWAEFVEDTSGPDEQELENIERGNNEVNAVDHDHWEAKTYEALEDPEHVPSDSGRITWTVTPVNGTPGNPNREKVLRSPPVLIGGLYWNIKYYPRGNDGTEKMSVYVECSPSSHEGTDSDEDADTDTSSEADDGAQARSPAPIDNAIDDVQSVTHTISETAEAAQPAQEIQVTAPEDEAATDGVRWETAAQIGCVVYNPNEPRVNVFRKSSHRFLPLNPDWGWTRFHGPWESIHLRQRNERQALLRNDTLVFTAYIRTVKDDTNSLWYHAPKQGPSWASFDRIGVKSLATGSSRDNAIIAAISCWLNLKPFVDFIRGMKIPNPLKEPQERNRPLFRALQQLLDYMFEKPEDTDRNAMTNVVAWIDWYIAETSPPRLDVPDVVAVWESLRRILNYEASGMGNMAAAPDCFQDVLLLRQPDPWAAESPILSDADGLNSEAGALPQLREPRSVQETVDLAASPSKPFRPWQSFSGSSLESDELPAVLQVELHRQRYDKKARRWDKLTHRVELNESITYTSKRTRMLSDYTLYGMVVHSGSLESHDFYSVVRPQGPGTRWIRYSGGHFHREAACLTTTQAVTAHEGKEEQLTGSAKVAYIVLYIRTDATSDILLNPFPLQTCPLPGSNPVTSSADADSEISVRIYKSTIFDSHVGRGLPDLWAITPENCPDMVCEAKLPISTPFEDVFSHLDDDFAREGQSKYAGGPFTRIWYSIETGLDTARGLPRLVRLRQEDLLGRAIIPDDGCRLWLNSVVSSKPSANGMASTSTAMEPPDEARLTQANTQDGVDEPTDTIMTQSEQLEAPAQVEPPQSQNDVHTAPASPAQPQVGWDATVPPADPPEQERDHNGAEDIVMDVIPEPPIVADLDPLLVRASRIYFFVKVFDSQAQTLRAVCSHETLHDSNVHAQVVPLLGSDDALDIFIERSRALSERDRVRSSSTFEDLDLRDGCILIAHRRHSQEAIDSLVAEGKHPDPISYFQYLQFNDDPSYFVSYDDNNYFGEGYHSASVSLGLIHGQGTKISLDGDAYVGNWVSDQKSGHGVMAYATGDTYTGGFVQNERHGQGKMVYGTTNNVYEGGWKNGRRHGKGVMKYEVADEEMAMCKICYENEMDALLYDCGHVVACDECARQVEICPICRKSVRGVCRIWKT